MNHGLRRLGAGGHPSARRTVIVDAHQHFWNLEREAMLWMTDEHAVIRRTFAPLDLEPLLARAGVSRTVLVQAACSDADTDSMFEHAARHDWIGGVIAWVDLRSPERARERLDELSQPTQAARRPAPHPRRAGPALDPPGRRAREPRAAGGARPDPRAAVRLSPAPRRRPRAGVPLAGADDRDRPSRQAPDRDSPRCSRGPSCCAPRPPTTTSPPRSRASTPPWPPATGTRTTSRAGLGGTGGVRPRTARVRQRLARLAAQRRLRARLARDCARDRATSPPLHAERLLAGTAAGCTACTPA